MADDWKTEARGLPVWVGAQIIFAQDEEGHPDRRWVVVATHDLPDDVDDDAEPDEEPTPPDALWVDIACDGGEAFPKVDSECSTMMTLDLENPDVLAAFDRRLALRLGARQGAVAEGVVIRFSDDGLAMSVEAGASGTTRFRCYPFSFGEHHTDVTCALLARVRAWRSVAADLTPSPSPRYPWR